MPDERNNVVKFQPRPKPPPPPKAKPKAKVHRSGEPAINWSRAPKAAVIIIVIVALMWVVGRLAGFVSGFGMG